MAAVTLYTELSGLMQEPRQLQETAYSSGTSRVRWLLPIVVTKILTRVTLLFLSVYVCVEDFVLIVLDLQSVHIIQLTTQIIFLNSSLSFISRLYFT